MTAVYEHRTGHRDYQIHIRIVGGTLAGYTARCYDVRDGGNELHVIRDDKGTPVELTATDETDALKRAKTFLENR